MIQLDEEQWLIIYNRIAQEYPASVLLISSARKKELGFTVRKHREWVSRNRGDIWGTPESRTGYTKEWVCLDFYDDVKETWFRLKFL
jgi:hypothetical protein